MGRLTDRTSSSRWHERWLTADRRAQTARHAARAEPLAGRHRAARHRDLPAPRTRVESVVCCLDEPGEWAAELTALDVPVLSPCRATPGFHPSLAVRLARLIKATPDRRRALPPLLAVRLRPARDRAEARRASWSSPSTAGCRTARPSPKRRLVNPLLSLLAGPRVRRVGRPQAAHGGRRVPGATGRGRLQRHRSGRSAAARSMRRPRAKRSACRQRRVRGRHRRASRSGEEPAGRCCGRMRCRQRTASARASGDRRRRSRARRAGSARRAELGIADVVTFAGYRVGRAVR